MKRFIPLSELKRIHLQHVKQGGALKNMALFTRARLSVQPLTAGKYKIGQDSVKISTFYIMQPFGVKQLPQLTLWLQFNLFYSSSLKCSLALRDTLLLRILPRSFSGHLPVYC